MHWDQWEGEVWRKVLKLALVEKAKRPLTEVQSFLLDSALYRGDMARAKEMIADWATPMSGNPGAYISKWIPGIHFYALDKKFATLEEAREHLERNGYTYLGFKPVRISDYLH